MQLLLKHSNPSVLQPQETPRDEAMESWVPVLENSAHGDRGWRDQGTLFPFAFLPTGFQQGHLQAAWQAPSKCPPGLYEWLQLWKVAPQSLSALGPGEQGRGKDGACREGQTTQGRAVSPRRPPSPPIGCESPSVPAQSIPGSQEPMGRAPFAQKEASKSRGERQKAKSPLTTSLAL